MAKNFTTDAARAFMSNAADAFTPTENTLSEEDKQALERLLERMPQEDKNEILRKHKETRSKHMQILIYPSRFERFREIIDAFNAGKEKKDQISINDAVDRLILNLINGETHL